MKLFKFNHGDGSVYFNPFDESEIEVEYNVQGLYYIDEDFEENLAEYREARNEHIQDLFEDEEYTLSEVKEAIEEFQEQHYYGPSRFSGVYGRPSRFLQCDDEEYLSAPDTLFDSPSAEDPAEFDDHYYRKYVERWDGSNLARTYLDSDIDDTFCEDVTDEYADSFFRKEWVGSTRTQNSTRHTNYYYDVEEKVIWAEEVSFWQGEFDSWNLIEVQDEIDVIFVRFGQEKIDKLRPEIREKYGHNLNVIQDHPSDYSGDYFNMSDIFEIFSEDDATEITSWVNDPYNRTSGGTYFEYNGRVIEYYWSAYQGDWCGYQPSAKSLNKLIEKSNKE